MYGFRSSASMGCLLIGVPNSACPFRLSSISPPKSSYFLLVSHICACKVNPMESRSASPPLSDGSSVRSVDSNRYSQTIIDQFINPEKFHKRLDRLLGPNEYICLRRQNSYIIEDALRTLSRVSASLPALLICISGLLDADLVCRPKLQDSGCDSDSWLSILRSLILSVISFQIVNFRYHRSYFSIILSY
jgi:hypothetical protein